jgi:PAP_fibrillin/Protein of unknown function (DUF5674)
LILIIKERATLKQVEEMLQTLEVYIKIAVDIEKGILAGGGQLPLDSLPLGLQIGKVYQVINIANKLFFNLAQVQHPLKIISGYVKVTASFEPALDTSGLADKRINVDFDKRYLAIEKIVGIDTPKLNPFKVVAANNPQGRIATLDITYLDETLRIGRGGDESLFILNKVNDLPNS